MVCMYHNCHSEKTTMRITYQCYILAHHHNYYKATVIIASLYTSSLTSSAMTSRATLRKWYWNRLLGFMSPNRLYSWMAVAIRIQWNLRILNKLGHQFLPTIRWLSFIGVFDQKALYLYCMSH